MNRLVLAADLRVQQRGPGGDADLTGPGADLQAQRVPERDCYSYYLRSADSATMFWDETRFWDETSVHN